MAGWRTPKEVFSGLAAILLATIPFWIVIIMFAISAEDRPRIVTLAVLASGLAGGALFGSKLPMSRVHVIGEGRRGLESRLHNGKARLEHDVPA